jgi:hypothetical protein
MAGSKRGTVKDWGREAPKALPTDGPPGETTWPMRHALGGARVRRDAALTGAALAACRVMPEQRSVTVPSTVLCRWGWGGDSVRLDLKGQGREALFDDIDVSRTVGRFTTLHPDSDTAAVLDRAPG